MVHSVYFQSLNKKNHHTLEYSSWNILLKGFSMWIQWIDNIHNLHACTSMWVSFCFWDDVNRVTCLCLGTYEIHCLWSEGNFQQSFWLCVVDENHMLKNTILTGEWEQKRNKYFNSSSKKPFFCTNTRTWKQWQIKIIHFIRIFSCSAKISENEIFYRQKRCSKTRKKRNVTAQFLPFILT